MSNVKKRGFGSMTAEERRSIARKGGKAVQEKGTAHKWDSDTARTAGRKGRAKQLEAKDNAVQQMPS